MRSDLSILNGAVLIPKPIVIPRRDNAPAHCGQNRQVVGDAEASTRCPYRGLCGTMMRGALLQKYCGDAERMRKDRVATPVTGEFNAPTLYNRFA
jgi:hypothetical protein